MITFLLHLKLHIIIKSDRFQVLNTDYDRPVIEREANEVEIPAEIFRVEPKLKFYSLI